MKLIILNFAQKRTYVKNLFIHNDGQTNYKFNNYKLLEGNEKHI